MQLEFRIVNVYFLKKKKNHFNNTEREDIDIFIRKAKNLKPRTSMVLMREVPGFTK